MWDKSFEKVIRTYLVYLPADEPLSEELNLRDYGLDSMRVVELLARLEGEYNIKFLDDALEMENFSTPRQLWSTLSKVVLSEAAAQPADPRLLPQSCRPYRRRGPTGRSVQI